MSEKDTISLHLVREALLQSCAPGPGTVEILSKVGIDPALLEQPDARVPATAYARLWRLLARRMDDEFFGMDPRKLKSGSLEFLCRSAMAQPTLAAGLSTGLSFLSLMLERLPAQLVHQQSLAEIVLLEDDPEPRRAFTYFTYWMIVHGVACWLAGRRIPILAIELRCAAPDFTDDYRVMFSENLRFERPRTRMIFSADCLDLPIKRTAEELKRFLAHAPANILVKYRDPESLASRIKQDLRQLRERIGREVDGMQRLVEDTLQLAWLDTERAPLPNEAIQIQALWEMLTDNACYESGWPSLQLQCAVPASCWVRGNLNTLAQALENILRNAIRHSPEGGIVRLDGRRDGDHWHLWLEDQGGGVAEGDLQRIFLPFTRLDGSRPGDGGFGLGLSIARNAVQRQGGMLWAENTGAGLRLNLRLVADDGVASTEAIASRLAPTVDVGRPQIV